jgi:hypothetical protein
VGIFPISISGISDWVSFEDRRIPIQAVFVFMIQFGADNRPRFVDVMENSSGNFNPPLTLQIVKCDAERRIVGTAFH